MKLEVLATYLRVPLSPSSISFDTGQGGGVISLAGKVTAGLVESNGNLPPSLWLMSPAADYLGSPSCPTLVMEYVTTFITT